MTAAPARILRPYAENCRTHPPITQRNRDRRAYILEAARAMFIDHGRASITLQQFAYATGLSQSTIRHHIADMDHLFGLILARHLDAVLAAVSQIGHDDPDPLPKRRAEYFRVTRGFLGFPTPMHYLFLRDRFCLPPDERDAIENQHRMIGHLIGGCNAEDVLTLLDSPTLDLEKIEAACALFASIDRTRQEASKPPQPAANPPEPPTPPAKIPAGVWGVASPPNLVPFPFPFVSRNPKPPP
jgi:AcrR family transcriptional regulator